MRLLKIPEANIVEPYVYAEPPNNSKTLVVKNLDTDWQDYIEVRSDSVMTASDAGTYTAYYHIKDVSKATWSDKTTADKAVQWTINRKPLTAKQSEFAGTYTEEFTFSYQYNGGGYVAANYTADVKEFSSTVFDSRYHEISGTTSTTGTGTFTVTITPAANYAWNNGTTAGKNYTWKVNRLPVKVTGVTLKEQTSGGIWVVTSQPITYDGQTHGSPAYYQIEPSSAQLGVREVASYEGASAGGTNLQRQAGKYIVENSLSSGAFPFYAQCILYIGAEEKSVTKFYLIWEIARAPIAAVTLSVTGSYVYDTTEQTVTIGGYDSKTMTISGNKATAAGTYTALITPDANHCWSDGTTDAKEVEWTIQPKQIDLPTAAEVDFPYDKTAHSLNITGYQPTYMTQSGTASATNAGSYAVTFRLKDTVNTAWATGSVEPYSIEWSIGLSKVEIPTAKTTAFIFSEGVLREPVFENVDTANVTMSGDVSATNAKDGSYTVIFSLKDTETTVWSDGTSSPKSYRWTIARKKLTAAKSTFTFAGTLNYSGSSWNVTSYISGYDSNYHSIGGQIVQTNADTYTAQIQPLPNYQWQEGGYGSKPVIWKIEPIEIAKPEITDTLPIEYDNKSHTPTVVNYNSSYMTRAGDYGAKTAAGDYQITFALKNTNNTTWTGGGVEPVKLSWSIEKKMVTIPTASKTAFTYQATYFLTYTEIKTQTLTITNPDADYCTQVDGVTSAQDAGEYSVTYRLKNTALTAWADGTTTDKTINWVINKAQIPLSQYEQAYVADKNYSGSEQTVTSIRIPATTGNTGYQTWWRSTNANMTLSGVYSATDAGEYTLYLTPTANYIWSDGTQTARPVTWRIKPAKIFSSSSTKVSVSTTTPIIANGTAQSPTLINYDPEKMTLGGDVSKTEKGEYVITVTPKSNYCWYDNSQTALEFDWRIVKEVYTVPAPNSTSLVFDGTTQAPFEYDTEKILGTNISASDAGTYTATFALADTASCEWADGTTTPKTVSWTIAPTTIAVPTVDGTVKLVYNSAAQLAEATLVGYDSDTMTLGSDVKKTAAGDYTVTVTPKKNCAWVGGSSGVKSLSWKIHRQPVSELLSSVYAPTSLGCSTSDSAVSLKAGDLRCIDSDGGKVAFSGYTNYMTFSSGSGTAVGDKFTASLTLKNNYCWADGTYADKVFSVYIRKLNIPLPFANINSADYTGRLVTFNINNTGFVGNHQVGETNYWNYCTASDNSFVGFELIGFFYRATATDAGEYYAKFAINDTAHYCWDGTWSESNPAGDSTPYTMYFYIGTAGKEIITPPELVEGAPTEVPYNGGAWNYLDLYVSGYDSTTMTASSSTSATNAGTYTLKIDLKDKTNTVWEGGGTATKTFTWKITPTLLEKPTVAKTEFEYNGKEQSLKISGFDSNTMSQTGTASATNVTSTSVTFALKDKTNYRWADGTTANVVISWKIVAASLPKPTISSATSFEYSGAAKSVTVKNYDTSLMTATGYLSGTAADTYTVTFALRNKTYSKWEDGTTADVTLNWEITPKKLTLEQSTLAQATPIPTYTGSEITVTITNFSASCHEYTSDSTITTTNVPNGTLLAYIKPRANYCWNDGTTGRKTVHWKIAHKFIEPPVQTQASLEYTGSAYHLLDYITGFDSSTVELRRDSGSGTFNIIASDPTITNVGSITLQCRTKDPQNVEFADTGIFIKTFTWNVTPKYVDKPSADVTSFTYCGEEQSLTVTGYDSATMTESGTTVASDAGTYTATYALKDKTNYRWAGGVDDTADVAISWEIKKLGTLPLPGGSNFGTYGLTNYTGSIQTPEIKLLMKYFTSTGQWGTVTGTNATTAVKGGEVQSAISKWYNVTGDFSGTNAGDYTISFAPNKNCTWGSGGTEARTLTWTINKASQTITPAKTSVTLNDDNTQSTVTITAAGGGTISVTSGDTNIVTASYSAASQMITLTAKQNGTATVTVKQAGNENYNAATNKVITVKVDRSIESLTWTEIQTCAKNGTLLKYGEIGDTKKLKIQGTVGTLSVNDTYAAVLIGYNHNADIEGSNRAHFAICKDKNGADFVFTDSSYNTRISSTNANVDKYFTISKNGSSTPAVFSNSAAADRLDEFLTAFPSTLQNVITACTKHSRGLATTYISSGKKVWTLSITEIGGSNAPYVNAKCEQYEYFANGNDINASNKKFWLRDYIGDASVGIDWGLYQGSQTFAATGTSYSLGIVPCFTIS